MTAALKVIHTATRHGQPLAQIDGLPGGCAEMTPQQMRDLAAALTLAADDCHQLPIRKGQRRVVREYPLHAGPHPVVCAALRLAPQGSAA
jgi:hypothetical protein